MSSHIASLNGLINWLESVGEQVTPTYKKIALDEIAFAKLGAHCQDTRSDTRRPVI